MARKIQLNSAYGAIGNEHFRYYRLDCRGDYNFRSVVYPLDQWQD